MYVRQTSTGGTSTVYVNPVPYQSPLRIAESLPSVVIYEDSTTGGFLGKVYKDETGRWFLETIYLNPELPLEVFAKYQGFLLLNRLHSNNGRL